MSENKQWEELELNKIYNEDCFITMKKMPKGFVDVVFTSPPYNRKRNDKYSFYDDRIDDYYGFLRTFIDESTRVTRGNIFLNVQKNYYNKKEIFKLIGDYANKICEIFIWEKSNPMPASGFNITNAYEFIIVFGEKIKSNRTYTKNHLTTSVAVMNKDHKAVMHEKTAEFFIENFTQKKDTIYDPFMGCGTTALVSRRLERNFIGSEILPEYCRIAEERLKKNEINIYNMPKKILTESGWKKYPKENKYRKNGKRFVIENNKHKEVEVDTSRQVSNGYTPTPCNLDYL
jgi:site-specific DNA-methyltransferase (adenine-specific)/modification methylase